VLASSLILHKAIDSYRHVRVYIAISDFVLRKHVEGGLPAGRMIVKRHFAWPVEPTRQGPGEYFMYVGRLVPEKGVSTLLDAWGNTKAELLIVGDGPEAARLRAAAPRNVKFTGTLAPGEVMNGLRRARAVLVPSEWHEGAGKVVLEAYAAGVPVLASSAGALPEVVEHEVTGLVLPPGEQEAWAQGVERLLDDVESERMGSSAKEVWSNRYSPERGLRDLEDVYLRALS
jgi:glycosyltransferase involved in cell wall biosynthesis